MGNEFWMREEENLQSDRFTKTSQYVQCARFPVARIKKIMKSVPGIHMVSSESVMLLNRAAEIYVRELTTGSLSYAKTNNPSLLKVMALVL